MQYFIRENLPAKMLATFESQWFLVTILDLRLRLPATSMGPTVLATILDLFSVTDIFWHAVLQQYIWSSGFQLRCMLLQLKLAANQGGLDQAATTGRTGEFNNKGLVDTLTWLKQRI